MALIANGQVIVPMGGCLGERFQVKRESTGEEEVNRCPASKGATGPLSRAN